MSFHPDEVKMLGVGAPVFLRMLRTREKRVLDLLYSDFRQGKTEFLALLAEYAVVRDQIKEITTALDAAKP